jgi:hypothetical protein
MYLFLFCNWGFKEALPFRKCFIVPKQFDAGPMNMWIFQREKKRKLSGHPSTNYYEYLMSSINFVDYFGK